MNNVGRLQIDFRSSTADELSPHLQQRGHSEFAEVDVTRSNRAIRTYISGIGSAFPEHEYSQEQISKAFGLRNPAVLKLMASGLIHTRRLYLPALDPVTQMIKDESPKELHQKFRNGVLDTGAKAAHNALTSAGLSPRDIDVLIAVTSSGFAVPGVSSLISNDLGMRSDLHRMEIVGMGCNAGMSALYSATNMSKGSIHSRIMILCCEINSASYVRDDSTRTGIVNSLFGDGASAVIIESGERSQPDTASAGQAKASSCGPAILGFETFTLSDQRDAMRFDWNDSQNKWSFFLSRDIPFVIGSNMSIPVDGLLTKHGVDKETIRHWIIHTGGGAVIDGAKRALNISEHDVRHTRSVLRDYGNISSGSFLVSLERLMHEGSVQPGDFGVMIAMGPGSTIETALVRWS